MVWRLSAVVLVSAFSAFAKPVRLPQVVLNQVHRERPNIDLNKFPWAKKRLAEHVKACGAGVVKGLEHLPNECRYQVAIDDNLLMKTKEKTGYKFDPSVFYEPNQVFFQPSVDDLMVFPETFDLRDFMTGGMPKIDRQTCGSCWANSSTKSLELVIAARDLRVVDLAEQTLVSTCCNTGDCNGGSMSTPGWVASHGLPPEEMDPYQGRNSRCKFSSGQIQTGWGERPTSAPWIGDSGRFSRFFQGKFRGTQSDELKATMFKFRSPATVTIAAIDMSSTSDPQAYIDRCSALNSEGDHMVAAIGWWRPQAKDYDVIQTWNSWGTGHGYKGVTSLRFQCSGGLNRGVAKYARVYEYKTQQLAKIAMPAQLTLRAESITIGKEQPPSVECSWQPTVGLENPHACQTIARPNQPTEYHLRATNEVGTVSAMVLVKPTKDRALSQKILTPFGEVDED